MGCSSTKAVADENGTENLNQFMFYQMYRIMKYATIIRSQTIHKTCVQ